MYILEAQNSFDSAHFLSGYEGKCQNIHGHRWKVEVKVQSEILHDSGQLKGMVVDFGDIKKELKLLVDQYDHALIIESNTMRKKTLSCLKEDGFNVIEVDFRPTAESFSYHFYQILSQKFNVRSVTVYETPTNKATYQEV